MRLLRGGAPYLILVTRVKVLVHILLRRRQNLLLGRVLARLNGALRRLIRGCVSNGDSGGPGRRQPPTLSMAVSSVAFLPDKLAEFRASVSLAFSNRGALYSACRKPTCMGT